MPKSKAVPNNQAVRESGISLIQFWSKSLSNGEAETLPFKERLGYLKKHVNTLLKNEV